MVSRKVNAALDKNPELFAFLPAINYGYLYYLSPNLLLGALSVVSLATGAMIYNYSKGSPDKTPLGTLILYVSSFAIWVLAYVGSLYKLSGSAGNPNGVETLLLFITIGFVFLGTSHLFLKSQTEGYEHEY